MASERGKHTFLASNSEKDLPTTHQECGLSGACCNVPTSAVRPKRSVAAPSINGGGPPGCRHWHGFPNHQSLLEWRLERRFGWQWGYKDPLLLQGYEWKL